MKRVQRQPESDRFDVDVRQPGQRYLATNPAPTSEQFKRHAYWSRATTDMQHAYRGICAYTSMYMIYPESVDHFKPKSLYPSLAYEWGNLRLCRGKVNVSKGSNTHLLDPFEIQDDWFVLDLPSCLIRAAPGLSPDVHRGVNDTINCLRLNSDDSYVQERCNMLVSYADGEINFDFLERRYPFLASEINRQGVRNTLSSLFKRLH